MCSDFVLFVLCFQIGTLPLASQESTIVEDLLYVLIGVDGRYITAQPLIGRQNRAFLVDPNLDMSVKELVTRILPVAASYSTVTRYLMWPLFSPCQDVSVQLGLTPRIELQNLSL